MITKILFKAHDVVAHEVYGEEAVRVTPPHSTISLTLGDEVEGPNGECPDVSYSMFGWGKEGLEDSWRIVGGQLEDSWRRVGG